GPGERERGRLVSREEQGHHLVPHRSIVEQTSLAGIEQPAEEIIPARGSVSRDQRADGRLELGTRRAEPASARKRQRQQEPPEREGKAPERAERLGQRVTDAPG